ncbi:MAG: hypothetical protein M1150_02930 [Patescibacteria group bacterium]|nr:hypothetical protein [Patescibacteria group bacterium]
MSHYCRALAISCIDFRFVTKIREYLVNKGLEGNYDLIGIPGASLAIDEAIKAIEISDRLHHPSEVYVFDHEDCGAYGEDNSSEKHLENLRRAKEKILEVDPKLNVHLFLTKFDEIVEVN